MNNYYDVLKKIDESIKNENWNEALKLIDSFLTMKLYDSELSMILHKKGICFANLNKFEDALNCFNNSWKINSYFINHEIYDEVYYNVYNEKIKCSYFLFLAGYYFDLGNYNETFSFLNKFLKVNQDDESCFNNNIIVKIDKHLKDQKNMNLIKKLCRECYFSRDFNNALKYANMALEINKDSVDDEIYYLISNKIYKNKRYFYEQYVDDAFNIYYNILNCGFTSTNFNRLIWNLSKAYEFDNDALIIKGFMLISLEMFKKAEKSFDLYLGNDKLSEIALIGKIFSLNGQNRPEEIFEYYNKLNESYIKLLSNDGLLIYFRNENIIKLLQQDIKKYDNEDIIILESLDYFNRPKVKKLIEEIDKIHDNSDLKVELLFCLHEYDEACRFISKENDALIKFKNYCKNKINTGYFGVFESDSEKYNWEYAYIESGLFKRLITITLEDLKNEVEKRELIWQKIDYKFSKQTEHKNKKCIINHLELIYKFDTRDNPFLLLLDESDGFIIKGYRFCLKGEYEDAINEYNKMPASSLILNNMGFAYLNLNKVDEALECFDNGLKRDSNDQYLLFNKTIAHLKEKNYFEAYNTFKKCNLSLDENFDKEVSEYFYNLGLSLYSDKLYESSIYCYNMCLKLDPKNSDYLYQKSLASNALTLDND